MKSDTAVPSKPVSVDGNSEPRSAIGWLQRRVLSPGSKSSSGRRSLLLTGDLDDGRRSGSISASSNCSSELQLVFDFFDENGDGQISAAELCSCVRTVGGELSMEEAEEAVNSSDVDGDGLLGFDDFQQLMEGAESTEEEKENELKEAFGMYVKEGSSYITPSSLKRMLSRLGEPRSTSDCKAMIRAFDLNGDGVLSFDEFLVMMR